MNKAFNGPTSLSAQGVIQNGELKFGTNTSRLGIPKMVFTSTWQFLERKGYFLTELSRRCTF